MSRSVRDTGRRSYTVASDLNAQLFDTYQLLDAQAGNGSGDDELLDLLGAFEDVEGLVWQYPIETSAAFYGR